jgi:hypothetical protein
VAAVEFRNELIRGLCDAVREVRGQFDGGARPSKLIGDGDEAFFAAPVPDDAPKNRRQAGGD